MKNTIFRSLVARRRMKNFITLFIFLWMATLGGKLLASELPAMEVNNMESPTLFFYQLKQKVWQI